MGRLPVYLLQPKRKRSSLRSTMVGRQAPKEDTFVSQDTSGVPSDAWAGERGAHYAPKWEQREGGGGHCELSPGVAGADSICPPWWPAQGEGGICYSRWTSQ